MAQVEGRLIKLDVRTEGKEKWKRALEQWFPHFAACDNHLGGLSNPNASFVPQTN